MNPTPLVLPGLMSCRDCDLCKTRYRVVPGFGVIPSKVMIVAQSPGAEENMEGKPLIGKSGQLLTQVLRSIGWDINTLYKTNINHCHPPDNRKATSKEINACRKWLEQEIDIVDPDFIICLGDTAYKWFLPDEPSSITQIRGNIFRREIRGRVRSIMPTVHPAFVARNTIALLPTFKAELLKAKQHVDGTYQPPTNSIPFRKHAATWDEVMDIVYNPDKKPFGFDLETDRLHRVAQVVGVGVCNTVGNGCYYPFRVRAEAVELMQELKAGLEDPSRRKIVSNAKFERHVCESIGIKVTNYYDTMTEAWLLGDHPLSLKDGVHHAYGVEMIRIDKFKRFKDKDWRGVPNLSMRAAQDTLEDQVVEYAAQDPDASLRLHTYQAALLQERSPKLWDLYTKLELPFTEIIVNMERIGVQFDASRLNTAKDNLERALVEQQVEMERLCGKVINVASTPQVQQLLYLDDDNPFQLAIPPKKKGRPDLPTDKVALGEHINNKLVRNIFAIRGIRKMLSTYIIGLPTWVEPWDGRIHANCKQTGTTTGRVSYTDPNLQNIPARKREDVDIDLEGASIRKAFVAGEGNLLYAPDLSQIEMRMAAHIFDDPNMIKLITEGLDIHDNTVEFVVNTSKSDYIGLHGEKAWKQVRDIAKIVGFGTLYGIGATGVLMRTPTLKLSVEQAQEFIDGFYGAYPMIKIGQDKVKEFTRRNGYAETMLGRRRYLPNITASDRGLRGEAERAAINVPIQGSAADYFKLCMLSVQLLLDQMNLQTKMIMQVHDEIVLEGPESEFDILATEVFPVMTTVYPLRVPVKIDIEAGRSWGTLISYEKYKSGKEFE